MALTLTAEDFTRLAGLISGGIVAVGAEETAFVAALTTRAENELMSVLNTNNGQADMTVNDAITTTKSKAALTAVDNVQVAFENVNQGGQITDDLTDVITRLKAETLATAATAASNSDATSVENDYVLATFEKFKDDSVIPVTNAAGEIDNVDFEDGGDTLIFRSGEPEELSVDVSEAAQLNAFKTLTTAAFLAEIQNLISVAQLYNSMQGAGVIGVTQIL